MSHLRLRQLLGYLRDRLGAAGAAGLADTVLLERFAASRDEAAFELLLWRHGPLVLNLCQRLLCHTEDAEDAFQATFLTLARKASSISKGESVSSWLYKVAYRIALRARTKRKRWLRNRVELTDVADPVAASHRPGHDLRAVLDSEIQRLPSKLQEAVILCYLEGKTCAEAAQMLGCPKGTVDSRLHSARERLRSRLERRGVTLASGALLALSANVTAAADVPAALVATTLRGAVASATGGVVATGVVSESVALLTRGMLNAMLLAKVRAVAVVVLSLAVVLGSGWLWQQTGSSLPTDREGSEEVLAPAEGKPAKGLASRPDADNSPAPALPRHPAVPRPHPLQGWWRVVSAQQSGKDHAQLTPDGSADNHILFSLNTFAVEHAEEGWEHSHLIKVEPGNDRGTIEFTKSMVHFAVPASTTYAIYHLKGDRLTVCWNPVAGGPRPTVFASDPENGYQLLVLERSDRSRFTADKCEWQLVAGEADGRPLGEEAIQAGRLRFFNRQFYLSSPDGDRQGTFALRQAVKPREIRLTLDPPNGGAEEAQEELEGIYELKPGELRICVGPRGKVPQAFTTKPGSGQKLFVLKQQAPKRPSEPLPGNPPDPAARAQAVEAIRRSGARIVLSTAASSIGEVVAVRWEGQARATDEELTLLKQLPELQRLTLGPGCTITDAGLGILRDLKRLKELTIANPGVTGAALMPLAELNQLEYLVLSGTSITDQDLACLASCKRLGTLGLAGTPISGAGLAHIAGLKELRIVYLAGTQVSDDCLGHLGGLKNLERLDLTGTLVKGAGLAHLAKLPMLKELRLARVAIDDRALGPLKDLRRLQRLVLYQTTLSDEGAAHLGTIASLRYLDISDTAVTDAGLAHLAGLKSLEWLSLRRCPVTLKGLANLRDALPDLHDDGPR